MEHIHFTELRLLANHMYGTRRRVSYSPINKKHDKTNSLIILGDDGPVDEVAA